MNDAEHAPAPDKEGGNVAAARAIIKDLTGRSGGDGFWDTLEPDVQEEIVAEWAQIIGSREVPRPANPEEVAALEQLPDDKSKSIFQFTAERLLELVYEAAGAATGPLLADHPGYIFPEEIVSSLVAEVVLEQIGLDVSTVPGYGGVLVKDPHADRDPDFAERRVRLPVRFEDDGDERVGWYFGVQDPENNEDLTTSQIYAHGRRGAIAGAEHFAATVRGAEFDIVVDDRTEDGKPISREIGEGPAEVRDKPPGPPDPPVPPDDRPVA